MASFVLNPALKICETVQSQNVDFLYDFGIKTMFGIYLQLFVGGLMSYLRYLCLVACSGVRHILCCVVVFIFLRLVYPVLPVSQDCPYFHCPFGIL